jgi:hypothetical protein
MYQSQWPRGVRSRSAAARLLGLRVRIPPGHGYLSFVSVGMFLDRGVCVGLVTRPQGLYWLWCVWVWSWSLDNEKALVHCGLLRHGGEKSIMWGGSLPHYTIQTYAVLLTQTLILSSDALLSVSNEALSFYAFTILHRHAACQSNSFRDFVILVFFVEQHTPWRSSLLMFPPF